MQQSPHILIVEDQYLVAMDCEQSLRDGGFHCVGLASNGDAAMELAARERPDLVLMDVRIAGPDDGVDVAIQLYERFGLRCLFTSGSVDAQVQARAERARPLGWLGKPYSGEALLHAVRGALAEMQRESSDREQPALVRGRDDAAGETPGQMALH